jgi:hypothetical protein
VIDPNNPPRWWTVDEANAALPHVTDIVARAIDAAQQMSEQAKAVATNGHAHRDGGANAFERAISDLEAEGIVLRDTTRGLIDFPAQAPSGRGYWLCWLVGEPEVAWWHWPEDGFAGRTPLSEPPET